MFLFVFSSALFFGCKGKGNPMQGKPTLGTLISSPSGSPTTSFGQSIVSYDTGTYNGASDTFPGQPNVWDIEPDFTLGDGNDDQFDGALRLSVGTTGFPSDQAYSELTFYGPFMTFADGVRVAAVTDGVSLAIAPLAGTYSAFLNPSSDSRIQQTVDLSSGTTGTIVLHWTDDVSLYAGTMFGFSPSYRVVVRDPAGNEIEELYSTHRNAVAEHVADLTAYAGQKVVLSFEQRNTPEDWSEHTAIIDEVSVRDNNGSGIERIANGGFEAGSLMGWTTTIPAEVQNMTSGERILEGLKVRRSFYTVPNKLWGRWVDVFENADLASSVTRTISYSSSLGSHGCGVVYDTPGTGRQAISSWDTSWKDRDLGMVFGAAYSKTYRTNTSLVPFWSNAPCTGSEGITVEYVITVPAGGKVALVNFIILGSFDTGLTASSINERANQIDQEAARIVNNFWTDGQYRTGMTLEQIERIHNF